MCPALGMTDDDHDGGEDYEPPEPPPISARVLDLFRQAKAAKSPGDRARAMVALSIAFSEEHDFTDITATDDWHGYVEDFQKVQAEYERAALRLARLVVHTMEEFYQGEEPIPASDLNIQRPPAGTKVH